MSHPQESSGSSSSSAAAAPAKKQRGSKKTVASASGSKRHQHLKKPQHHCLSYSAINKLARKAGVGMAEQAAKDNTRAIVDTFIDEFCQLLLIYAGKRRTIRLRDVDQSARRMGINILGLGAEEKHSSSSSSKKGRSGPFGSHIKAIAAPAEAAAV